MDAALEALGMPPLVRPCVRPVTGEAASCGPCVDYESLATAIVARSAASTTPASSMALRQT